MAKRAGVVAEPLAAEADRDALEHQRRQRGAPAVADPADDGVGVERDVVEEDLVELGLAGDLAQAADGDALGVHRQDEHRHALVLGHVDVGAREQQPVGGELRVGRPDLLAGQAPAAVLLLTRARLHGREVRAGGGLGEELAPDLVAVQHRPEVAALVLVAAVRDDRRAEHPDADRVEDPGDFGARDLLVADDLLERAEALAAVLLGPRDAGEAALGEAALPGAPRGDDLGLVLERSGSLQDRRLGLVLIEPARAPARGRRPAPVCRRDPRAPPPWLTDQSIATHTVLPRPARRRRSAGAQVGRARGRG